MKIPATNTNQQLNNNFTGKLITPEKVSETGKCFLDRFGERISRMLEPEPYDLFLIEAKGKQGDERILLGYNKGEEPKVPVRIMLNEWLSEFNRTLELKKLQIVFNEFLNMKENIRLESIVKPNRDIKPFVPKKIGKPEKPYTKRRGY